MMDEEIRQAVSEVREMKQMCGNINMKLTNIVTQRGQNWKEKLEAEYQRGLEDGKKAFDLLDAERDSEYQRGLNDAWECGKKLAWTAKYGGYGERLNDVFGRDDAFDFYDYTPNEAIEKLKSFKQKQDDKITVGDEVEWDNDFTGDRFIVTRIYQPYGKKEQCDGIDDDGDVYRAVLIESLVKTGRHFDIASILEAMKHD